MSLVTNPLRWVKSLNFFINTLTPETSASWLRLVGFVEVRKPGNRRKSLRSRKTPNKLNVDVLWCWVQESNPRPQDERRVYYSYTTLDFPIWNVGKRIVRLEFWSYGSICNRSRPQSAVSQSWESYQYLSVPSRSCIQFVPWRFEGAFNFVIINLNHYFLYISLWNNI